MIPPICYKTLNLFSSTCCALVRRNVFIVTSVNNPCIILQLSRGLKRFHRKPFKVIRHDPEREGKSVEEYAENARSNAVNWDLELHKPQKNYPIGPPSEIFNETNMTSPEKTAVDNRSTELHSVKHKIRSYEGHPSLKFLNFQIFDQSHKKLKQYLQYGSSPKLRYSNDIFLVEGWRLLAEALVSGLKPEAIYFSRSRLLAQMAPILSMKERELAEFLNLFPLLKTPYHTLQTWSAIKTSPGITAAFKLSEAAYLCQKKNDYYLPTIVILDEIKDPSNLGSIIRSLVAAGIEKIILMKGCCDLWDTKVLRAACGGHFRAKIETRMHWSRIMSVLPSYPCLYVADAKVEQLENDGDNTNTTSSLPLVDDENVDLRSIKEMASDQSQQQTIYEVDKDNNKIIINESYHDKDHLNLFAHVNLPQANYHAVNYFSSCNGISNVLLIGGETGLSNAAKKFAIENEGTQVFIPMNNGMQSLNNAVTCSIIIYEMLRQFENLQIKI